MLKLYNTLTRRKEEFKPNHSPLVGLYTCGPTVYNYAHIGNLRTYIFEDILKRVLRYNGYKVKHVMNITDVGHLTDDADQGEDKMEKGSRRERKSVWEIADFYTVAFKEDIAKLNIIEPNIWCRATDNIDAQIKLVRKLEKNGYTYKTSDGIYYDTSKFKNYTKLSHLKLEELQEGARVAKNEEKKNPTDFALWKFSPSYVGISAGRLKKGKREMEWNSPWGIGFPGWHIECSAMSMVYLGNRLDIHCGGIDHINVHHTNEIAQSEAATGRPFFNFWMHGAFLNIAGGKKMAKSGDNFLTLENAFIKKRINPLTYRFAALQTHYRKPMEYSDSGMKNAEIGLERLYNLFNLIKRRSDSLSKGRALSSAAKEIKKFKDAVNDDLNTPKAMAVVREFIRSDIDARVKKRQLLEFDKVLGLGLDNIGDVEIPAKIIELAEERKRARDAKDWRNADYLRLKIKKFGFEIEDMKDGEYKIRKK